jgi:hypothetical protein
VSIARQLFAHMRAKNTVTNKNNEFIKEGFTKDDSN